MAWFALVLVLAGCSDTAAGPAASPSPPTSDSPTPRPPPPTTTPTATLPSPAATTTPSGGTSFGVDSGSWPTSVRAAAPTMRNLPRALAGQPRQLYGYEKADADGGPRAGVSYGDHVSLDISEEYLTKDTPSGKAELLTANDLLAASFLLGLVCDPTTYEGTAPSHGGGVGPAVTGKKSPQPVWFSCRIAGAEGNDNYTGQALGWTSGKTAWLVVGENKTAVRSLVGALRPSR